MIELLLSPVRKSYRFGMTRDVDEYMGKTVTHLCIYLTFLSFFLPFFLSWDCFRYMLNF